VLLHAPAIIRNFDDKFRHLTPFLILLNARTLSPVYHSMITIL